MDKPRRRWFRIHLSTAIVLMFLAGGLLWANFRVQEIAMQVPFPYLLRKTRGWPTEFFIFNTVNGPESEYWVWQNLIINLLTSIGLIILAGVILELNFRIPRATSDKLRRAWFQIHLSTAIVLMIVAGGMLTLNLSPRKTLIFESQTELTLAYRMCAQIGWPLVVIEGDLGGGFQENSPSNVEAADIRFRKTPIPALREFFHPSEMPEFWSRDFHSFGLAINSVLFVFVLTAVASILEFFIRRREARAMPAIS